MNKLSQYFKKAVAQYVTAFLINKNMFKHCVRSFLILAACVCFSVNATAQKLTYKIFMNKNEIGTLFAEKDVLKENVHYLLKSKMIVEKVTITDGCTAH